MSDGDAAPGHPEGGRAGGHAAHDGHDHPPVDCGQAVQELYVFLDGELTEERKATIASHLDGCHHCLEAFEFELELRQLVARRCREEVPSGLRGRVAAAIALESGGGGTSAGGPSLGRT